MPAKRFPQEFQISFAGPGLGKAAFEHFALMVDGARKVMLYTVGFDESLIEMPAEVPESAHRSGTISADFGTENLAKANPPLASCLMGDVDPALVEQVLDVWQVEGISDVHHHGQADDFREVLKHRKMGKLLILETYPACPASKRIYSDRAVA